MSVARRVFFLKAPTENMSPTMVLYMIFDTADFHFALIGNRFILISNLVQFSNFCTILLYQLMLRILRMQLTMHPDIVTVAFDKSRTACVTFLSTALETKICIVMVRNRNNPNFFISDKRFAVSIRRFFHNICSS